ncbi:MAG TPA: alpha-2-macroglobulin family protein [Patescibacteria group bacterium]|nr:alpha-2-macroglobulin family protein [Patescibacteria group bacterium]
MRQLMFALALLVLTGGAAHAAFDSTTANAEKDLHIIRVTPTGEDVAADRQIVFTFNRNVVPVGQMERKKEEIPVTISPAVDCEWRWINPSSLACQLTEKAALDPSTRYDIEMKPGIKAEDGTEIAEAYKASFITQRANVEYNSFRTWLSPGMPVIRLTFNQPVSKSSVQKFITIDSGIEAVTLDVKKDDQDNEAPRFVPFGKGWLDFGKQPVRKSDDQLTEKNGEEARRVWIVQPQKELPLDTTVTLKLAAGLVSALGPEPAVAARDLVTFDTYPEFNVVGLRCTDNEENAITIDAGKANAANQLCNPMGAVYLMFSAPVKRSQLRDNLVFTPALGSDKQKDEVWGDLSYEYSRLNSPHVKGRTYDVNLPFGLKAAQKYTISVKDPERGVWGGFTHWVQSLWDTLPETALEDEFARQLAKPFTVTFETNHRKPNFELEHHDAVLEKGVDSEVPLYVNNLEKLLFKFRSVTADAANENGASEEPLENVQDVQYLRPFNIRKALGGKTGAVYGHMDTIPYVNKGSDSAYRLFAVVTPWQMHVKLGHFASMVWVTDMATGAPVKNAKVTVYKDTVSSLSAPRDELATATTDEGGIAEFPGTDKIDPQLDFAKGWEDSSPRIFVRVDKDGDMALMPLNNDFVIDTWRASNESINASTRKKYGHMKAWGTTAQGIYRAGDTIQYKFYVRNQDNRTLTPAETSGYTLEIVDPMDNVAATVENLTLNEFGAYSGEFTVGKEAPVGWYKFKLTGKFKDSADSDEEEYNEETGEYQKLSTWIPLRVLVSDFTPVPFRVTSQLNGDLFRTGQEIESSSLAQLHSGGPFPDAEVRTTAILTEREFSSKDPKAQGFTFVTPDYSMHGSVQIFQKIENNNGKGELAQKFKIEKQDFAYGRLMVESAVADDRGKYVASEAGADYVGVDRFVGMKSPEWAYEAKKPVNLKYIVVDENGAPVADTKVAITIEKLETTAVRVQGAGNAYLTNYTSEWKKAGNCGGTPEKDEAVCSFTPDSAGSFRAIAKTTDTKGAEHSSGVTFWVTGSDYVMWDNQSDVLLPIIPEKTEYHVGDKARYLVKNPFPGATALVTIERYGVLEKFAQKLDGSTPVIEFEVKPDYLPGFYLSVIVTSPRVDKPIDKDGVDLGKPTFRMAYVTVPVKDPYKEMVVTAKPAADVYRPRDKVAVELHAEPRMKGKAEPVELAVAVLDEAVFDLVTGGLSNFDPYNGFYKLDGLDLKNYSLLTRLIGRQKFEKKGANQGGDGGSDLKMRDLFKFVAYWNPSLKTDKSGNAKIEFEAPDNLTGWRVLVLAVTPTDRLGLGQGNFKVNRPTEVRPVMPNQVLEGDSFQAGFSVMNRTDKARTLTVEIKASGTIDTSKLKDTYSQTVTVEPYKRATVLMPVKVGKVPETRDLPQGEIVFEAKAYDLLDGDGMVLKLPVNKFRSLETAADYGTTTQDTAQSSIQFPKNIFPDIGSLSVVLSPTVIGAVEGAFRYMRDYPYICWEQILTKGVMASHYLNLKSYMPDSFVWPGAEKLAQAALDVASSFQAPNGGMSYFVARDDYVDPYLSAYTALAFNWLRHASYKIPETVERKLQGYLQNLLRNNVMPTFYDEGMSSTIRAVALAALAENGKVDRSDLDRYKPHLKEMSLFGKTHFLMATLRVKGAIPMAKDVANDIISHSNQTGGKFIFQEKLDDSYLRILASPLRENCAILGALVEYGEKPEGASLVGDIPFKLVRTITQTRENRDHWENTQENMFCMNALIEYSRVYENVKPDMRVTVSANDNEIGQAEFEDFRDKQVTVTRPITEADVGLKTTVDIERKGDGRLYYATRLRYAPKSDFAKPVNSGIELHREYSVERDGKWTILKNKDAIKRGELVRVDLFLSLPAARNFVAVNDPLPGGLETVNRELGTASKVDADKGDYVAADGSWFFKFSDWEGYNVSRWSFYHQEMRHDSVRFYSDYLPPGNYHLSYTAQAIAEGQFTIMPTLAEEMYDPDVYGKDVTAELTVTAKADAPAVEMTEEKTEEKK